MILKRRNKVLVILFLGGFFVACKDNKQINRSDDKKETVETFQNKGHELVYKMVQKVGGYKSLSQKNNVQYTYTYETPDGKKDVSTERYIFNGELSYGNYKIHERTLPQLEGTIEQGYDGKEFWLRHNGEALANEDFLKRVKFNRPTNFYWFTMMPKLLDPGVIYEHLGEKTIDNQLYDIVKITFKNEGNTPTDIYQIFINQKTELVDQFLFTVADFGVMETPNLMLMDYENIDGILLPTKRKYKKSSWDAKVTDTPWIKVTWSDIIFDTEITKENFKKK
ncbi:DUF6503 family protein [Aquimarina agarivorans]|uniref:DUF6503 family protein n=1 Tax=Aquimarina agarivorans TaxID=980584 RepID=UPI000248ED40|nr:DUF6503 family protein [Aquimarina agarivorans]